jgi:hypothetical protein
MGVLVLVLAWLAGPALCLAALTTLVSDPQFERLARARRAIRARWHPETADSRPSGRPIEAIAADARRLGRQLRHPDDGRSQARVIAIRLAYDDVLAEGCSVFGIPQLLGVLDDDEELVRERRRVESALVGMGLVLEDVY